MPSDFRRFLTARFFFVLAMQMQSVILGWQMYVLTGSAFCLGFIGLAEAAPALGLSMYAGYYVDHRKPLPVFSGLLKLSAFSAVLMILAQSEALGMPHDWKVIALFSSSFLTGVARAFAFPAIYTLVPGLVPRDLLPRAAAVAATTMQVARISGPALGGILYGLIGVSETAAVVCGLLLLGILMTTFIENSPEAARIKTASEPLLEQLLAGFRFVWSHQILLPAMALDCVSVFLGGVTALLPIYVSDILHSGSETLGLLRAAPSIGAAIVGVVLLRVKIERQAGPVLFAAVIGFGVSICVFALSRNVALSAAALVVSGCCDSISVVIRSLAIQLCSPDSLRGRISSVNAVFVSSSNELGEFESGMLAGLIGAVPAALFGGVACIATAAVMGFRCTGLRSLDLASLRDSTPEPVEM